MKNIILSLVLFFSFATRAADSCQSLDWQQQQEQAKLQGLNLQIELLDEIKKEAKLSSQVSYALYTGSTLVISVGTLFMMSIPAMPIMPMAVVNTVDRFWLEDEISKKNDIERDLLSVDVDLALQKLEKIKINLPEPSRLNNILSLGRDAYRYVLSKYELAKLEHSLRSTKLMIIDAELNNCH